jgi:hypothetical protein
MQRTVCGRDFTSERRVKPPAPPNRMQAPFHWLLALLSPPGTWLGRADTRPCEGGITLKGAVGVCAGPSAIGRSNQIEAYRGHGTGLRHRTPMAHRICRKLVRRKSQSCAQSFTEGIGRGRTFAIGRGRTFAERGPSPLSRSQRPAAAPAWPTPQTAVRRHTHVQVALSKADGASPASVPCVQEARRLCQWPGSVHVVREPGSVHVVREFAGTFCACHCARTRVATGVLHGWQRERGVACTARCMPPMPGVVEDTMECLLHASGSGSCLHVGVLRPATRAGCRWRGRRPRRRMDGWMDGWMDGP